MRLRGWYGENELKPRAIFNVSSLNKALNQRTCLVQIITFGMVGASNVLVGYTTYLAFVFFTNDSLDDVSDP